MLVKFFALRMFSLMNKDYHNRSPYK